MLCKIGWLLKRGHSHLASPWLRADHLIQGISHYPTKEEAIRNIRTFRAHFPHNHYVLLEADYEQVSPSPRA